MHQQCAKRRLIQRTDADNAHGTPMPHQCFQRRLLLGGHNVAGGFSMQIFKARKIRRMDFLAGAGTVMHNHGEEFILRPFEIKLHLAVLIGRTTAGDGCCALPLFA